MKLCLLTPRFPFPENGGDVLRINNIARYLKSKNHELILISFYEKEIKIEKKYFELYDTIYMVKRNKIVSAIMSFCAVLTGKPIQCGYYFSLNFLKQLRRTIKQESPEIYISHLLRMIPYLEMTHQTNKTIVEMTDALSKTYQLSSKAKGSFIKRLIYKLEVHLIKRYEKRVIKNFPKIALVSESDIEYLSNQCGKSNSLYLYTNGVDCLIQIPKTYKVNQICFVGNMRTLQNQDAVIHFINDILPKIKNKLPQVVFKIIGAEPSETIKKFHDGTNIIVTGFVDDIRKEISECCVAVAPVRVAAGIQNKVLMAMGCGVPVVLTPLISSAIKELEDGENCFIVDNDIDFAQKCIDIISNTTIRQKLSESGYKTVKDNYSWNKKLEDYEQIVS